MKVILRSDVEGVGRKGDVCDVADGFARNFLVPNGQAIKASPGAERQAETMRKTRELKEAADIKVAQEMASRVVGSTVRIGANAGEGGRLFGSVTVADVVTALQDQLGVTIERKDVTIDGDDHIKELGAHSATAKVHAEVQFPIAIEVIEA